MVLHSSGTEAKTTAQQKMNIRISQCWNVSQKFQFVFSSFLLLSYGNQPVDRNLNFEEQNISLINEEKTKPSKQVIMLIAVNVLMGARIQ